MIRLFNNFQRISSNSERVCHSENSNCSDITDSHSIPESVTSSISSSTSTFQPITSIRCISNRPLPPSPSSTPPQGLVPSFDSRIISDFPEFLAEFRQKRFLVLWRDSGDGFKAQEFHRRYDGRANSLIRTLTLNALFGTKRNTFADSASLKSNSSDSFKRHYNLKSFQLTVKYPPLNSIQSGPFLRMTLRFENRPL
jgi:hypothetical protein